MKIKVTSTKWTFLLLAIATIIIAICSISSLNHYSFSMAEESEEAGIAYRGFPFHILKSESFFYAGYVGRLASSGGSNYIREKLGENPAFEILFPGIIANSIFYTLLLILINAVILYRKNLIIIAIDAIKQNGTILGIIKTATIIISIIIFLLFSSLLTFGLLLETGWFQ